MDIEQLGRQAINRIKSEWGLPKRGFIAGGSIANIIWELVSGNKAVVNDIDIFLYVGEIDKVDDINKEESLFKYEEKDIKYFEDYSGMSFQSYTKDFYTICESERDGMFNTITYKGNTSDPSLILKSFDINATRVGYLIEEDKVYWDKEFENFVNTGELQVSNLMTPSHTAIRIVKKSDELNITLSDFEMKLTQYASAYRFSDSIKLRFKDRYYEIYEKYKSKLDKFFRLDRDLSLEKHVLEKYCEESKLYYLVVVGVDDLGVNPFNITPNIFNDKNLSQIFLSDLFLFYMRNIYGNPERVEMWSKLKYFFNDPNYIDKEVDIEDINLLERFSKNAPDSIDNLRGYKLSEQISIIKKFLDRFKDDPIIAISILEKYKIDKDIELDDKTVLLLELSVRKDIVNDTRGKVNSILNPEITKNKSVDPLNIYDDLDWL